MEAYILIECAPNKVKQAVGAISKIKGVDCAQAVVGPYDIIAYVKTDNIKSLGELVVAKIQSVKGVNKTMTCIAVEL